MEKHHDGETNVHSRDSVVAFALAVVILVLSIIGDVRYFLKWQIEYREDSAQVFFHGCLLIVFVVFVGRSGKPLDRLSAYVFTFIAYFFNDLRSVHILCRQQDKTYDVEVLWVCISNMYLSYTISLLI